jgi:hypothetical protein
VLWIEDRALVMLGKYLGHIPSPNTGFASFKISRAGHGGAQLYSQLHRRERLGRLGFEASLGKMLMRPPSQ